MRLSCIVFVCGIREKLLVILDQCLMGYMLKCFVVNFVYNLYSWFVPMLVCRFLDM